jgi:acetyl-CoA carboxylase biotin carboxyl carrier protein
MREKKKPRKDGAAEVSRLDLPGIEAVLDFMGKHGLEEFEYERGDLRIRLRKGAGNAGGTTRVLAPPEIVIANPSKVHDEMPASQAAPTHRETPPEAGRAEDVHTIKSPIVGTFYGAPSPGAEPFVKIGDTVQAGQVLCIIEAMKLMNEIESDADGEVRRIFVENGQPVEYGEPLFAIHPRRKK